MINELRDEIHQNAVEHGWWEKDFSEKEITDVWARLSATPGLRDRVVKKMQEERSFGDIVALCHSELSEALEEYRNGNDRIRSLPIYYSGGGYVATEETGCCKKPEGIAIELADCIIRILDYCGKAGIDIEEAIEIKHEYNKTRPYRHGGKKI